MEEDALVVTEAGATGKGAQMPANAPLLREPVR